MRPRTTLPSTGPHARPTTRRTRAAAALTAAAVALAGAVTAAAPAQAALKRAETPFVYQGSSFGTRVQLADPSAGAITAGRTGWSVLGCTDLAPLRHGNNVADVGQTDAVDIGAVTSTTSTFRRPKRSTYGSRSTNKVTDITLGSDGGPQLTFGAITTTAVASNVRGKFRAAADVDLVGVDAVNIDGTGAPQELQDLLGAIGAADDQLVEAIIAGAGADGIAIPGLGTIYPAGGQRKAAGPAGANANAFGIRVVLENGRGTVTIGRAWARIQRAQPAGVFVGNAYSIDGSLLGGTVSVGRNPFKPLPCRGTGGRWQSESLPGLDLAGQVSASAMKASVYGKALRDGRAVARTRGSIGYVKLGDALEIKGIVGQVNVKQNVRGRIAGRTVAGTSVGSIVADGTTYALPAPGETLEIPGVARITFAVRRNLGTRGIRVHALQVTLLDEAGAAESTVNLGTAKAWIN